MIENTCKIGGTAVIGYTPENNARSLRFDIGKWKAAWPDATPEMLVVRPDEDVARPVVTRVEGNWIIWTVRRYDTEIAGSGRMWVIFSGADGEMLGETPATRISVMPGPPNIDGEEPPETEIPWMSKTLNAASRAEDAAKRAEDAADRVQAGGGTGGGSGEPGEDGGYYMPSVSSSGDLSWQASKEGMPEVPGANIKGPPGAPGYTPQKGVDYFDGAPGTDGKSATLNITGAESLPYGSEPTVTELPGSTPQNRYYRIGIPEGKPGADGEGGGSGSSAFRYIRKVTIPEDPSTDQSGVSYGERTDGGYYFAFDTDENGNPFSVTELIIVGNSATNHTAGNVSVSNSAVPSYAPGKNISNALGVGVNGQKKSSFSYSIVCEGRGSISYGATFSGGISSVQSDAKLSNENTEKINAIALWMKNYKNYGFVTGSTFEFWGR